MSDSQLLLQIQPLLENLENTAAAIEEILYNFKVSSNDLSTDEIGEILGLKKGLNIDGTITIKDNLELALAQLNDVEDMIA